MKKKLLFTFLAFGLILTTACGKKDNDKGKNNVENNGGNQTEVKGPIANTENGVVSDKVIDGLKFTNISLIIDGSSSDFYADVINTNNEPVTVNSFQIVLKDAEGNIVTTLPGFIGATLQPNDSVTISTGVEMDLTNIKSVEFIRNN